MKTILRRLTLLVPLAVGVVLPGAGRAAPPLLEWRDLDPGGLRTTFLDVERPVTVHVTAVGTIGTKEEELIAYPWILDAQTRKVTWILDPKSAKRDAQPQKKAGTVRVKQEADVRLAPGHYEVYFTAVGDARRIDISTWFGLMVPAGTPADIIKRLNEITVRAVALPETRDTLLALGFEPQSNSPEQFAAHVKGELKKFAEIVKASGAKFE